MVILTIALFSNQVICVPWQVVVLQLNGIDQPKESVHVLNIGKLRMRLSKGKTVVAKEFYSSAMQVGFRNVISIFYSIVT